MQMYKLSHKISNQIQLLQNINLCNIKYIDPKRYSQKLILNENICFTSDSSAHFLIDFKNTKEASERFINKQNELDRTIFYYSGVPFQYDLRADGDFYFDCCDLCRDNNCSSVVLYVDYRSNTYDKLLLFMLCTKKYFMPKDILILILEYLLDVKVNLYNISYCDCYDDEELIVGEKQIISNMSLDLFVLNELNKN